LKPAEVVIDATLLYALLQAVLDWGLDVAVDFLEFKLDVKPWPPHARLTCRFGHPAPEPTEDGEAVEAAPAPQDMDSMAWRLVEQISWTLGLVMDRAIIGGDTLLTLEFP